MKRSVIVLASTALLALVAPLAGADTKIGVVNVPRLMSESPQAKAANDTIVAEFQPRQREIQTQMQALKAREDKLNKDAPTMTEVQRSAADKELRDGSRDLQLKQSAFQDDLNARRQEEQDKIQRVLAEEVQNFAKANGYDLIVTDAAYFSPALDVTGPVLQALQARKGPAPAPAAAPPASKPAPPPTK